MFNPLLMEMLNPSSDKQTLFDSLVKNNPQFAKFVEDNKGKTPEQIAQENNIDMNLVKRFM